MVNDGALSLAIDLGGTTLLIGAVNRNGSVVRATVLNSGYRSQRDALEAIMSGVETFLSGFPEVRDSLIVAGAGLVGQVDPHRWCMALHVQRKRLPRDTFGQMDYG